VLTAAPLQASDTSFFDALRAREYSRLDHESIAYLDYTGSSLYAESQVNAHRELLAKSVFGNPHAESGSSRRSTALLEAARARVLEFLDADDAEYEVVFTANASGAIKLVGESYPFGRGGELALATDNHNSMNGLREFARRRGSSVRYLPLDRDLRLSNPVEQLEAFRGRGRRLLAFPAQSNFSGVRHSLDLVTHGHALGYDVLLDAASFVPTSRLSLRRYGADFVALSFYKVFGYPTGVGALVARRSALAKLERPWFAGGTVDWVSVQLGRHQLHASVDAFEDGTPNFLAIAALEAGFDLLRDVGVSRLAGHVQHLTVKLLGALTALRHVSGDPLVRLYGPSSMMDRGGCVAFNLLDRSGAVVPFALVEARAREKCLCIRGGCFCNPGASEVAFDLRPDAAERCLNQLGKDFSIDRFAACLGAGSTAVGALRASVGIASTTRDVDRLIDLARSFMPDGER
jgi:selenocysteine lyase/cysteine desulfurase